MSLPVGIADPLTGLTAKVVKGNALAVSIILTGNKNISGTVDAVVEIFEATADDLTTSIGDILVIPVGKSAQTVLPGILIEVPEAVFIMGKTSDDDVLVTILGFYL